LAALLSTGSRPLRFPAGALLRLLEGLGVVLAGRAHRRGFLIAICDRFGGGRFERDVRGLTPPSRGFDGGGVPMQAWAASCLPAPRRPERASRPARPWSLARARALAFAQPVVGAAAAPTRGRLSRRARSRPIPPSRRFSASSRRPVSAAQAPVLRVSHRRIRSCCRARGTLAGVGRFLVRARARRTGGCSCVGVRRPSFIGEQSVHEAEFSCPGVPPATNVPTGRGQVRSGSSQ